MENVLSEKGGPAKVLDADRFKVSRKPRDDSPEPPNKTPPNTPQIGAAK